jgi:hypothetical protein
MKTFVAPWPSFALVLLAGAVSGAAAPKHILLATADDEADFGLAKARGAYSAVGEAFGHALYRRDCADDGTFCSTKFLYRSGSKGLWTLTGSSANVDRGKGTVISTVIADSPVGLGYKVYRDGNWTLDGKAFR